MAQATYAIQNFLGGEISSFSQGRFDKPDYRVSLNVCLNAFPAEIGPWVRRPGSQFASTTRGGAPGRVIKFDFEQATPYTIEFTDSFLRFRNGAALVTTNDSQIVVSVSAANPAVVQTTSATNWATGNTLIFSSPSTPLLENRQLIATKVDATHFSLADAISGLAIDGSTLGTIAAGATVSRVQELATGYVGAEWGNLRAVQAETTDILLTSGVAPQALTVATLPSSTADAVFALNPAIFNDGPYLDPFVNGVQATPGATSGIVAITLGFAAFSATTAYAAGSFTTAGGVNYVSLKDQNVGQTPASSPTFWAPSSASAAINNGQGFLGSDIGRLVRLFSEPPLWTVTATYATGAVVTYNPTGLPGASTYWQALGGSTGKPPGSDLTSWQLVPQGAAIWTWGKITSLLNVIDRVLAGSVQIGDMISGGGLNAAFNGVFAQLAASSAQNSVSASGPPGFVPAETRIVLNTFVGKNYTGAAPRAIQQATVFPTSDRGLTFGQYHDAFFARDIQFNTNMTIHLNLRGSMVAPANSSDGTLLGTQQVVPTTSAVTIISNDQVTAWNYVWIELNAIGDIQINFCSSYTLAGGIGQVSFYSPIGTGTSSGVDVEILGSPLLYAVPVLTWRLGAFSNTTGWPTCGCYYEGRLWLGRRGAEPL